MQHTPTQEGSVTTDRPHTPLPADRAFVVQLRADADLAMGAVSGRVEHVSSGSATLFDSVDELIAWMHRAIDRPPRRAHRRDPGGE
jgi:hypothetical protein